MEGGALRPMISRSESKKGDLHEGDKDIKIVIIGMGFLMEYIMPG